MLFKWFLDLSIDDRAFDPTTFTKNRQRLLDHEIADRFFAAVVAQAKLRRYLSSDHFSVDGTLLQAWASNKSFKPDDRSDDGDGNAFKGRNAEVDFKGQKRSNATHTSTTDPEAMLFRKSNNTAAELSYMGHLLIENRSALIVDAELTQGDRLRGAGLRDRHGGPAPGVGAASDGGGRQELRHQRLRGRRASVGVHAACRAEYEQPPLGDRWAHDPPCWPFRICALDAAAIA